jgi:hypothetical protein
MHYVTEDVCDWRDETYVKVKYDETQQVVDVYPWMKAWCGCNHLRSGAIVAGHPQEFYCANTIEPRTLHDWQLLLLFAVPTRTA